MKDINRRSFIKGTTALGATLGILGPIGVIAGNAAPALASGELLGSEVAGGKLYVYAGSWGHMGGTDGITAFEYNPTTGGLTLIKEINDYIRCGQTTCDFEDGYFYCEDERTPNPDFGGNKPDNAASGGAGGGNVWSFKVDRATGILTEIGKTYSYGAQPSYVTLTDEKDYMLVTLYGGKTSVTQLIRVADGSYQILTVPNAACTQLFRMNEDHTIGDIVDSYQHYNRGHENNAEEFEWCNAHAVIKAPDGKLFVTCDKGASTVTPFVVDHKNGKLKVSAETYDQQNNEGARYAIFHQTKPFLYINNEKFASIDVCTYDKYGNLEKVQTVCPLPEEYVNEKLKVKVVPAGGKFEQQDFKLHPNGKYIYNMMRCANGYTSEWEGCSVLEIKENGLLELVQFKKLDTLWPRGCAVSPDGKWFLVASLYAEELLTLPISANGQLGEIVARTPQRSACNLTFFPEKYTPAARPFVHTYSSK
ncbi:MAG: beta-propeller fold lactonase family protein [Peptococcaceae bacterium]|jgi:6-phosphogluconolactonase (cycloisomerase 2 family)|nr:beta-propeller fold lactonase family protein [Peptococcaceae bacterium]